MAEVNGADIQRLLGALTAQYQSLSMQLVRIEAVVNKVSDKHDSLITRVAALELDRASIMGGWKATVFISGTVIALWTLLSRIIVSAWPFLTGQ